MKIAIIGDLHLSYKQYGLDEREKDFYRRWQMIISDIIARQDIDLVLQLGDIFDNHLPSPIALYEYEKGISQLLDNDISYYSITGNHTIIRKQNFMSPDELFTHILDITSLDDTHIVTEDGTFIAGIKYRSESNKKILLEEINKQTEHAKKHNGLKILLLHQAVDIDLIYGAELQEHDLPVDVFDYIFIGHIHSRIERQDGNCKIIYPGSIERSNTTEAKDEINRGKGFIILDTDTQQYGVVTLPCKRRFIFAEVNNESDVKEIKNQLTADDKVWNPIVELTFNAVDIQKAHEIGHIIADDCLRLNINVANDEVLDDDNEISIEESISSIQHMLEQKLSKKQAVFAYDLLQIFNKNEKTNDNIISAINLSDKYFDDNFA